MRDFELPGRSTAYGQHGMAATSHPLATLTALDVLRAGGNAVDAAIAAVAVQCVVEPHMTGIGGDCFVLYAPASGGVVALNGSGRAPAALTVERLLRHRASPRSGRAAPHAVTVPGRHRRLGSCCSSAHGTRGAGRAAAAGDPLRRGGLPGHAAGRLRLAPRTRRRSSGSQGGRDYYLPGGKAPEEGRLMRLPALARTLRRIAEGGARAFYEGEIARAAWWRRCSGFGGLHTEADFAAATAEFVDADPHRLPRRRGLRVPAQRPGHRRAADAQHPRALRPRRRWARTRAARLHLLAEATRLAFRDRDAALCRPGARRRAGRAPARQGLRQRAGRADRPRAGDGATCRRRCSSRIPTRSTSPSSTAT